VSEERVVEMNGGDDVLTR